jgi:hypothetical protein
MVGFFYALKIENKKRVITEVTTLFGYWFRGWVSNKPKFNCSEQITRIVRPLDGCVKQSITSVFYSFR